MTVHNHNAHMNAPVLCPGGELYWNCLPFLGRIAWQQLKHRFVLTSKACVALRVDVFALIPEITWPKKNRDGNAISARHFGEGGDKWCTLGHYGTEQWQTYTTCHCEKMCLSNSAKKCKWPWVRRRSEEVSCISRLPMRISTKDKIQDVRTGKGLFRFRQRFSRGLPRHIPSSSSASLIRGKEPSSRIPACSQGYFGRTVPRSQRWMGIVWLNSYAFFQETIRKLEFWTE